MNPYGVTFCHVSVNLSFMLQCRRDVRNTGDREVRKNEGDLRCSEIPERKGDSVARAGK